MSYVTDAGGGLLDWRGVEEGLEIALTSGEVEGHNVAYDFGVAWEWFPRLRPLILQAYRENRVTDTMIRERCLEIVGATPRKKLDLDTLAKAYGLPPLGKDDGTRLDYGRFYGVPLEAYPPRHAEYAVNDSIATRKVGQRQRARGAVDERDVAFLTRKAFWLQITRNRGLRTDPARLGDLERACKAQLDRLTAFAQDLGLIRANGTKDMAAIYAAVTQAYEGAPPLTEKGRVKTDALTLEESEDPALTTFAELGEWRALYDLAVDKLPRGISFPLTTKWGIADTTRVTSSKPNVQNLRRDPPNGPSVRECFVPREGFVFLHADWTGLENCTLAQWCKNAYGLDRLVRFLNAGGDLHCATAGFNLQVPYEDVVARIKAKDLAAKDARQFAKIPNFGRPGGMGAPKLQLYARKQAGLDRPVEFWQERIKDWERANPDGAWHLTATGRTGYGPQGDRRFDVPIPGTNLVRHGVRYAAACNTPFQALGAVVAGHVGFKLLEALQGDGALGVCHLVNFIHDEFALECPDDPEIVNEAALELTALMAREARLYLPDIDIRSEATAMRRWSKSAESKWINGTLTIWG